jgi:uncharacterized protein
VNIKKVENYIYQKLKSNLSPTLTYHGFHHTIDVVESALRIAQAEGINDKESLIMLETAALYHDLGFISTYKGHEEEGCRIAQLTLPKFDYSEDQILQICGMIMATKIPQNPQNILEQIIADADLDYLGRDDFELIANSLFLELREREMIPDLETWNKIQVKFLESHHYWTKSAIATRNEAKLKRIDELKKLI